MPLAADFLVSPGPWVNGSFPRARGRAVRFAYGTGIGSIGPVSSSPLVKPGPRALAERFGGYSRLSVRQRKRWLEILLSFEFKNAYDVYDENQQAVLNAAEVGSGPMEFFRRAFLGPFRPFEVEVKDLRTGEVLLRLRRPFRFIFHRLEVYSGDGTYLGAVQREWAWIRRIYKIEDADGAIAAELFGPILKPWTFEIRQNGQTVGSIRKRWSGMGRELFTDADNFGVDLGSLPDNLRMLAFAATVLIDVVHFERAKN